MTQHTARRRGQRHLSIRKATAVLSATLLVGLGLAAPAVADATPDSDTSAVTVSEPTTDTATDDATDTATPEASEDEAAASVPAGQADVPSDPDTAAAQQDPATPAPAAAAAAPAAATLGTATGLNLTVLRDGTPNSDGSWDADDSAGNDSSENNGIVRTHDSVVYRWGWSVATAGDVTLTQTLPVGMSWVVAESTAACVEGESGVSADGRTLTCTRPDQATGASTYQVRAMVDSGANGQVMSSVLSSAGTADSAAATVTVSARPMFQTEISYSSDGTYREVNGVPGFVGNFYVYLYQPVDATRGVRGGEALADPISFQIDASNWGANSSWTSCAASGGGLGVGLVMTDPSQASSTLPNAGTWGCSQSSPGSPIDVTISGAITDVRSYPTATSIGTLNATRAYVSTGQVMLWTPLTDYTAGSSVTAQMVGFDPDSVSGQSNYGTDYATGHAPGAALALGVNGSTTKYELGGTSTGGLSRVYADNGADIAWMAPIPPGTSSVISGTTPMYPGQTLRFGGYNVLSNGDGSPVTNAQVCAVWDEATMTTDGTVDSPYYTTLVTEYAHLDVSTDAQRKAVDCGVVGDGDAAWSSTPGGVDGGASAVNAVRYSTPQVVGSRTDWYSSVSLTRTDAVLAGNQPMPVFFQTRADGIALTKSTFNPQTQTRHDLGARALAAAAETAVEVQWDGATSDPGLVRTVTVQPVVTVPSGSGGVAQSTTVTITLPVGVSMVANSWPAENAPTSSTENADGTTTYVFPLGDLVANETATPLTFKVGLSSRVEMPTTFTIDAVIASPSDPRAESYRQGSGSIVVNSPAAFSATKLAGAAFAVPGVPVTYTVSWLNGLESTVGVGKIVDVLPFVGDGRGTTGLSGLTFDAVNVTADMAVTTQYTTDASATVLAALNGDRSGDTGISWLEGTPPSNTTALRFVTGDIDPSMVGEATITVTPGALATSGVVVNDLSGAVELLAQPLTNVSAVELPSGAVSLSGTVYKDADYSFSMDSGEAGLAGVTVQATGYTFGANGVDDGGSGDDRAVTATDGPRTTTAADGTYTIDGLAPGSWTVSVDGAAASIAGLDPAEIPATVLVQPAEAATGLDFGYMDPVAAPVLVDDTARVSAGDSVQIPVLTNDTIDASATITAISDPTVTESGGVLTYTAGSSAGTVTFTYTVTDKARQSATATVTVTVVALPTAANSSVVIGQTATVIDVAGLFTGDGTSVAIGAPGVGTATISGTEVTYTPGGVGSDSFTYTVTDSMGKTATGTVNVTVLQAPDLADDTVTVAKDQATTLDVTANDPFVGTGALTVATAPAHGTAVVSGSSVVYTPTAGYTGSDSFTYTVTDSVGQSDTATVTIAVVEGMILAPDTARTGEAMPVTIDVLANDVVTQGEIISVTPGATGSTAIVDGKIVYTPTAVGTDTFSYTVRDLSGATAAANVTVTVLAVPTATDADLRTGLGATVEAALQATGDGLTLAVTGDPANGTAAVTGGTVSYTPAAGFVGTDQITLTWTDSVGQTVEVTVTIEVLDAPIANDDTATTLAGTPVTVDVLANDQGDGLTVTEARQSMFGTVTIEADGSLTYTPNAGFSGRENVVYQVTDSVGQTAEASLVIAVYAAPMPPELSTRTGREMAVVFDPANAATDTGDALLAPWTVTGVDSSDAGEVVLAADGTITFTPAEGFVGTTTFGYTVLDELGQTGAGTITVTVVALTTPDLTAATAHATAVEIDLLAGVGGDGVTVTGVGAAAHGTVTLGANGVATYTPADGFSGQDTFTVTYLDEHGQVAEATVTVTVAEAAPTDDTTDGGTTTGGNTVVSQVLAVTGTPAGIGLLLALVAALVSVGVWLRRRATRA